MARVLHLLPSTALRLSIQDTEAVLIGLRHPIDQLNSANADRAPLSAFLGGRQNADLLVQCLSKFLMITSFHFASDPRNREDYIKP